MHNNYGDPVVYPSPSSSTRQHRSYSGGDNTAGVGTFLYASPEQNAGRAYNATTDIYSLGMVLVEMSMASFDTHMERYHVLTQARQRTFPVQWKVHDRPEVLALLHQLLSPVPSDRPSAADVCAWCDQFFGQRVLLSHPSNVDSQTKVRHHQIVLRVEAKIDDPSRNILLETSRAVQDNWSGVKIQQCGVRVQGDLSVLEFVLEGPTRGREKDGEESPTEEENDLSSVTGQVMSAIEQISEVMVVRDLSSNH